MTPEYKRNIQIVRTFDPVAADYLENEAPKLYRFKHEDRLSSCFVWTDTPQGVTYWNRICVKVDRFKKSGQKLSIVPDELFII